MQGIDKFAGGMSAKYEGLKWVDVVLKPHRDLHTAMGDHVVLKKLGNDTEMTREKSIGWRYFVL